MTQSMTAFARDQRETPFGKLTVEIRSVNNRYLDFALRLAEPVRPLEPMLRERISARVKRGRVELTFRLDAGGAETGVGQLDDRELAALAALQRAVLDVLPDSRRLSVREALDWPGVVARQDTDETRLGAEVEALLDDALEAFVDTRRREGARLAETITQRIETSRALVEDLQTKLPAIQAHVRDRLATRLQEILDKFDAERIEQEVVLLLNKSDVEEEIDRLKIHFDEVTAVLRQDQPVGRRLDFLMQELNREANTLGSKAAHPDVTNASMELKVLIEQMREQVQNIE